MVSVHICKMKGANVLKILFRNYSYRQLSQSIIEGINDPIEMPRQVKEQMQRNAKAGALTELIRDFLDPASFYHSVKSIGIEYFCGVPDTLLKEFCAYVNDNTSSSGHVITANEGTAVSLAAGYHLATNKFAMVYLQNSGLGNLVNPVMSLAHPEVYLIPMLFLIGWRGEPGKKDEPQHLVQGQASPGMLASLGIPFQVLPDHDEGAEQALLTAQHHLESGRGPYALLVKRQTFLPYNGGNGPDLRRSLDREEAVEILVDNLSDTDIVVAATGMLSRELYEYRTAKRQGHKRDFLTVGGMGHASSIALGIAIQKPDRQVVCLDGDGGAIMHLGAMATIGQYGPPNFKHVLLNNGAHDSVGGQKTDAASDTFSFQKIALGCGYKDVLEAATPEENRDAMRRIRMVDGPVLLEVKVNKGHRANLGRPIEKPVENKEKFMQFIFHGKQAK